MPIYEFGPYAFDTTERRLLRGENLVPISGKAAKALHLLADAGGRLVTREEFLARLWPDTTVEERNLTVHISTLRKALNGDGPVDYIETVPTAGYRLTVPVCQRPPAGASVPPPTVPDALGAPARSKPFPITRIAAAVAALVALLALAGTHVLWSNDRPNVVWTPASDPKTDLITLSVLPFAASGLKETDADLGLGIADAVTTQLCGVPRLGLRPTSATRAVAEARGAAEAGRALGVGYVIDGLLQREDDRLRVTVQLVEVETGVARWGERFEQPMSSAFKLQDDIAARVAGTLLPHLSAMEQAALQSYRPRSAEAYFLQIGARANLAKAERASVLKAAEQFQQAIALDPDYALAHSGLASAYAMMAWSAITRLLTPNEAMALARRSAERAIALDDRLGEPHAVLASLAFSYEWDWTGAEKEFHRAVALSPNAAEVAESYGWFLSAMGRHTEALAELERAHRLDPIRRQTLEHLGFAQWMAGDAERGLDTLAQASALDPTARRPHMRRMFILDQLGRTDDAMAERARWLVLFNSAPLAQRLTALYAEKGYKAAMDEWLAFLARFDQSYETALQHMAVGEKVKALEALEQCVARRCTAAPFMLQAPSFRPLRGEPRFDALIQTMKLGRASAPTTNSTSASAPATSSN